MGVFDLRDEHDLRHVYQWLLLHGRPQPGKSLWFCESRRSS